MESFTAAEGIAQAEKYAADRTYRFVVEDGRFSVDALDRGQLQRWIAGDDPIDGSPRGMDRTSPDADLLLDATVNGPKTFSLAAKLDGELEAAFEAMQDRLRDRVLSMWQAELNTRRGRNGVLREALSRIEVVELKHERSRALDPHKHRHLWLSIKVRGVDGKWSRVDSRVAMKFQNVVNAEGDLAARTDPQWVAALAAKGLTIDPVSGEIVELAHLVRPLSRRANQIDANRQMRLERWRGEHPGQDPSPKDLAAIDRWAWSHNRPGKPVGLDEAVWADTVRAEIAAIDPGALHLGGPDGGRPVGVGVRGWDGPPNVDLLAAQAVVEADARAAGYGGRFSAWDVRAAAVRAVARAVPAVERAELDPIIERVREVAAERFLTDLVPGEAAPEHVKVFLSKDVATIKTDLAERLERLSVAGVRLSAASVQNVARDVVDEGVVLDAGQVASAGVIAGSDRVVTVVGPAGAGKTTMLRVAVAALGRQGRRSVVLAPTKKASSVAGREAQTAAASVHRFLLDHGWTATTDRAGRTRWVHTPVGSPLPGHDQPYPGPVRWPLRPGDRIVIDEAGMLDADTARIVAAVAEDTGAGLALIGDPCQVMPVGLSGAMELARRTATATAELDSVHRFRTPDGAVNQAYADLTLRMRQPRDRRDAEAVAYALVCGVEGAVVTAAESTVAAQRIAVDRWCETTAAGEAGGRGKTVAIVTSTNEQAQTLNEAIQARRIQAGELDARVSAEGLQGQLLLRGDLVQTRQNSTELGVENRALWRVLRIHDNGAIDLIATDHGSVTRTVPADYAREHVHLAYASTVHGIQGETVDASIVMPGVDAAGLYVGMTRGREVNEVITLASTRNAQVEELASTMLRGMPEASVGDAQTAALSDLRAAARAPEPARAPLQVPRWDDPAARPFGRVTDLPALIATVRGDLERARTEMSHASDQLHAQEQALVDLERRIAHDEARAHARVDDVELDRARELATVLRARLRAAQEEARTVNRAYGQALARWEYAQTEARVRQDLPVELRHEEERARVATRRSEDAGGPLVAPAHGPTASGPRLG
ncbi:AAA family ATPase [Microbacterium sp. SL62]|uniref:AAA family ATPase n=1 Tax=Microbacterium sp. SL62 TaxID=2995139 RepID=UPI002274BED0|nr:AAA family ATPase [Microbacterium sp. SL62]MCY1718627.1 AAA family ATPase [Microbacterium sp. SL62]